MESANIEQLTINPDELQAETPEEKKQVAVGRYLCN